MSLVAGRTNNTLNSQYNIRSLFVEGFSLNPLETQFFIDSSYTGEIKYGQPMVWTNVTAENGIITGGTVVPMTATYDDVEEEWTTNGVLACFAITLSGAGTQSAGSIQGAYSGTIVTELVDLSEVSQTAGETFTFADLIENAPNMSGAMLPNLGAAGQFLFNLLGIQPIQPAA